jgi:ADP-heptose:LPS heptosyltransferase
MKPLRRIAVLRALHLGDMLCAVPALRSLRAAQPRASITLIGLPWAQSFVERFHHYIDELMVLPSVAGMPEQSSGQGTLPAFIEEARQRHFDLAIQLHGSGTVTNKLLLQLGAARNAGFYAAGYPCPDKARFLLWQEVEHEVLRAVRLMQTLGAEPQGNALEFPLTATDTEALRQASDTLPAPGSYACIHPGARMPSRRWPYERFAEVADRLAQQGLRIVLTGSDEERELVDAVEHAMHMPALNLAGKTSLGAFATLIAHAGLIVCNDTGASHMAAAVGTPSVVVCCGSDPLRWAPLDRQRHRVLAHTIFCRPCMHQQCPIGHPCALNVSVDMVMEQANDLLEHGIRQETTAPAMVVGGNGRAASDAANQRLGRSLPT